MTQQLKDHSLKQLNSQYLAKLTPEELLHLSTKLLHDLKEAREQINQNSNNSSKPPSSGFPWETSPKTVALPETEGVGAARGKPTPEPEAVAGTKPAQPAKRKAGKQPGAPGYGRVWHPPINADEHHYPSRCEACGRSLDAAVSRIYTAYDSVDIQFGTDGNPGLTVITTRHHLHDSVCTCGHVSRHIPHRQAPDPLYPEVDVGEWRLIGGNLAALIVHLRLRSRLSLRGTQELLREVLGIPLSVGVLQQCFEEAAASASPLEDALVEGLLAEATADGGVLYIDETSWKERGEALWLWTFVTTLSVCFYVGQRTIEMLDNVISPHFGGWLMSDGYAAYRHHPKRLRCWAHLIRKARGLAESLDKDGRTFGNFTLAWLRVLQDDIYAWRAAGGTVGTQTDVIRQRHQAKLLEFRALCLIHAVSAHDKTAALAKEFINDWDAIFRILDHPWLPLTNNEAERALRHWVILRKTNHGTKSATGSRAFAMLASIIGTCRKRGQSALAYLASVITAARAGFALPALPQGVGM
ncbi:IS66 family transposase [Thiothrix fructosivorans]|uniref:IS66 family transposase n=3 Tax=Thiothrix fructosivorans TaxID=111770 RepID=UPI001F5E4792|nr:IS66 family transposase [Thiothrix fructosivorans]